ncbi:hypothetical protein [Novipirellula aureliae]|uniref:hypothetical protein n=1 Tax=Novipirellula aureliae TaxID=2527966 RepID=UPI0011B4D575|nr:hypothetical protein [Novipirellula aureliae]
MRNNTQPAATHIGHDERRVCSSCVGLLGVRVGSYGFTAIGASNSNAITPTITWRRREMF